MSDFVDEHRPEYGIEELLKRKALLEQENHGLASQLKDGDEIKSKLKEAQKDSKKLLRLHEKLKSEASKHLKGNVNQESKSTERKELERSQFNQEENEKPDLITFEDFDDSNAEVSSQNRQTTQHETAVKAEKFPSETKKQSEYRDYVNIVPNGETGEHEIDDDDPIQLRRELNAMKVQLASLIREKRKVDEQNSSLVQELVDMSNKYEKQQTTCDKLRAEITRLSRCLSEKSSNRSTGHEEDIQALKTQLHESEEGLNGILEHVAMTQRSNERLRAELNEARAVIRDLRKVPAFELYPAPVYQPLVFSAYDQDRYGHLPSGYKMVRSASAGYVENRPRVRSSPKRNLFKPDLTAVIDQGGIEVEDHSLMSSRSF